MDVRIAHTVAYLLWCQGATGNNVNDEDDDGNGATGDKVDNDCNGMTDDDVNDDVDDDDEGTTMTTTTMARNSAPRGACLYRQTSAPRAATARLATKSTMISSARRAMTAMTMVMARGDAMMTTMAMDVVNDDNKCDDAILMMCDEGDNHNHNDGEDACTLSATMPAHWQRQGHSQS